MDFAWSYARIHRDLIKKMEITWYGNSCFQIKGSTGTVVTDAYADSAPKLKADILALGDETAREKGRDAAVDGNPKVLDWPGEYEVSGISVESYPAHLYAKGEVDKNLNIFVFTIDGMRICNLSTLNHDVSDELLEKIGDIDVLFAPIGGKDVIGGKTSQTIVEEIDPRIIIPSCYESPAEFLKLMGKTDVETLDKFVVKAKSELPFDKTELVLLNPLN